MAQEDESKHTTHLGLHQRHGGRVNGSRQRQYSNGLQRVFRRDRKYQSHDGIGADHRCNEQYCRAKRCFLKQVSHPAMQWKNPGSYQAPSRQQGTADNHARRVTAKQDDEGLPDCQARKRNPHVQPKYANALASIRQFQSNGHAGSR